MNLTLSVVEGGIPVQALAAATTPAGNVYPSNLKVLGSARMTWFEGKATI
ncbi:hypothetical protein [Vibrio alfacsensis]